MLKTKTGELRRMKNADYLPAFYFLPAELVAKREDLFNLPRNPNEILRDWRLIDVVESDLFIEMIIDGFAFLAWRYMGVRGKMEQYSGHDPFWRFAHKSDVWVEELIEQGAIPLLSELLKIPPDMGYNYNSMEYAHEIMSNIVPIAMARYKMDKAIEIVKETRCPEDFDKRQSQVKIDFHRQWYHTRTKIKTVSLENYYIQDKHIEIDVADERVNIIDDVCGELAVDEFKKQLSDTDMQILEMRMQGIGYQEIADKLGFKTHSAVQKRIKKLTESCEDFFVK